MGDGGGGEVVEGAGRAGRSAASALALTFQLYEPDLVRFLTRRLRGLVHPRESAEDLAQEAFIRLAQIRAPILDPRAMLFCIASNLACSHAKAERRRAELRQEAHDLLWEGENYVTPERHALAGEILRRTAAAIADLPPRARQVLTMARIQGLTAREIATELGVSTRAVEKSLALALARLTTSIGPDWAPSVAAKRTPDVGRDGPSHKSCACPLK